MSDQQPLAPPPVPPLPPYQPLVAAPAAPVARKDRRVLRAVLRWGAAVLVLAAAGVSTAYGVTRMDRTDLPGLATASDGRWDYPEIVRPPLPSGSPGPFAEVNSAGAHYADLRALVLPAPAGAVEDKALRGKDGWLATGDFLAEYAKKDERTEFAHRLADHGLRHVAARGWTTKDGTHTRIYLLQFGSAVLVDDLFEHTVVHYGPGYTVRGAGASEYAAVPGGSTLEDVTETAFAESKPYGAEQVRQGYLSAGDTLAVVLQSRKGSAPAVPFHQTMTLQAELLD
ncbi:hypothetical protein [Streptomyces anandii]|uniref:hypothetical protein n=1 Tax=Streptomyces anandii TaxID=285454 RepID=UPI00378C5774